VTSYSALSSIHTSVVATGTFLGFFALAFFFSNPEVTFLVGTGRDLGSFLDFLTGESRSCEQFHVVKEYSTDSGLC